MFKKLRSWCCLQQCWGCLWIFQKHKWQNQQSTNEGMGTYAYAAVQLLTEDQCGCQCLSHLLQNVLSWASLTVWLKKRGVLHNEKYFYIAWKNFVKSYTSKYNYHTSKTESLFKHSSKVIFLEHIHRPIDHHTFIFSENNWKWWCRHQLFNGYSNCIFHSLEIWFSWATVGQHLVSLTLLSLLSVADFCFPGS